MPGDNFQKRSSGDPFVMKAPLYNALIDAARQTKQNRHDVAGNYQPDHRSSTIVPIRNGSGGDKPRGGILGIAGPIIGPADNFDEFLSRVALEGASPTLAHVARWAVLLEPLEAGAIGRAVVSGLAICQVEMRNDKHQYAEINDVGQLESGDSGSARIVWVAATAGTQWAIVNIDSPRNLQAKFELIEDLEEAATADAYLLYQDNLGNWRRVTPNVTVSINAGDYSVENTANDNRSGPSFTGVKFGGADGSNSGDVVEAVGWIEGTTLRWFAIGAGHKVVTGTTEAGVLKGAVGQVNVDLQPPDNRTIQIFAKALVDLKAGDAVIAWWNGPLREWYMAKFLEYAEGCGIIIDEDQDPPTINVDNLALVGPGLAPVSECGLTVVAGCGIQVGVDVSVDPVALAGNGLVPAATGCALDVNPGCGIRVVSDQVKFEPDDVVGAGLGKVGDCGIDVLRGCGLFINDNNELEVDSNELAGPGLTVFPQYGDCVLGVTTGCGLVFSDATKDAILEVDLRGFDGCGLNAVQMTPGNDCWGLEVDAGAIAGAGLVASGIDCSIQVSTGCGIVFGPSNELEIDLRGFDGPGLTAWQNPSSECWGLQIDCQWIRDNCDLGVALGCGLFENAQGEVEVVPSDLAGKGLVPGGVACELDVALGCGLQFDATDQVEVDASALAGGGLVPEGTCGLAVNPGCGLQINEDTVEVNPAALAGAGLTVGSGCELLAALGCGLAFDEFLRIAVDTLALSGHGLAPGENCELDVQLGCGLQFDALDRVEVNPVDLESSDIGPTGSGCSLGTKGFTGDKQVVVAIECDPYYDPYGCPVAVVETWHFVNGLLKAVT